MMIQQNLFDIQDEIDTPVGYKKTEAGIIPSDWETPKFGEICTLINGRGFKPYEWSKRGLPIIRIQNLNGSDDFNYYEGPYDPKIFIENGQLLFAWSGSRGTSFGPHIWKGQNALLNYHTWKLNINHSKVDDKYFYHILKSLTKVIEDSAHGASALVHTQKGEMEQFDIPLPPSRIEQQKIATALSDTDTLISELEKLINKKQAIKTATMQQLLTGKTRLPEFALRDDGTPKTYKDSDLGQIPEDWEVKSYGEIFKFLSTSNNSRDELSDDGEYYYIHYGDIHTKFDEYVDFSRANFPRIAKDKVASAFVQSGDLVMADASEDYAGIGKSIEVVNIDQKLVAGLHTFLLRDINKTYVDGFRAYLHLIPKIKKSMDRLATGMKVYSLSKSTLLTILLPVPSKEEQEIIVNFLQDIDLDLAESKVKLEKLKLIKQGMMQELLTGKTRLV